MFGEVVYAAHQKPVAVSDNRYFARYGRNLLGRDFAVGDIHGEFSKLSNLLDKAGFNTETDRLFSVGDLVDRGAESHLVYKWLMYPWFKAVLGNHDFWCVEGGLIGEPNGHREYGGEWFYALPPETRRALGRLLYTLPVAIEVEGTKGERFGVVHGECTCLSWGRFIEALEGELGESYRNYHAREAMWRVSRHQKSITIPIAGIDLVFVGHTTVGTVKDLGNVRYIDTGGVFEGGKLTLVEMGGTQSIISV
ncbi:metallophosphoesterase [Pseudomonas sp. 2FE]|uniref:metallophosphoesterase n=1 Tax=Pseudomonas sp. 2FE TaxID=2502190 RepID=UPI0010F55D0D|nr:metallophosphoesterase [Pseudomonas sp. 2FE]